MTGSRWVRLLGGVALVGSGVAQAQLVPAPLPTGPAAIQPATPPPSSLPTREQVEQMRPDREQRPRLRIDSQKAIAASPCPLRNSDLKVGIERLRFTGAGNAELAPELAALLGSITAPGAAPREVAVVCDIRDEANARLAAAGYIASVQIPPQAIETGELRLEVISARIVEMRVRGDAPPYRRTLEARAEQLKGLSPLNQRDAERILLAANEVPGLDVQLALSPAGTRAGEVIGELTVIYRPYSLLANINNYGSRELGREIGYVRGEVYGLLGNQDYTFLGASASRDFKEQKVLQVGHGAALGSGRTRFEISALNAWSRPDLETLDLRSTSLIGNLTLSHQLIRQRRQRMDVATGFEIIEQRTRLYSNGTSNALNRDRLRIGFVRADGELRDYQSSGAEAWSLVGSLEVRQGFDILNATKEGEISPSGYTPSRFQGDPTALVVRSGLDALVGLGTRFSLLGRVRGQWANNPLLNFEEFSIGTLTIGRGYDPGSNSGDRAVGVRIEPRVAILPGPTVRLEAFAFGDRVWLWNLDPNALEAKRTLDSFGGGLRALLPGVGYLEAMYARPRDPALLIPGAVKAKPRLLISLTAQFPRGGR